MMTTVLSKVDTAIGGRKPWREDALWVSLCCLAVYLVTLALRLSLWTVWDHELLRVGDEFILSTHDSYLWLAQSRSVSFDDLEHLAWLTKVIHQVFGVSLGNIGFWAPAVLASLVAPACFLWGWLAGGRTGGIIAGLVGAMSHGFYLRSKLGYYDTDLFTLLMPMATGFLLAWWAGGHIRRTWLPVGNEPMRPRMSPWSALAIGLFIRMACWWHQDLAMLNAMLVVLAGGLIVLLGIPERRPRAVIEWAAILLAAIPGMGLSKLDLTLAPILVIGAYVESLLSIALAVAFVVALRFYPVVEKRMRLCRQWWWAMLVVLVFLVVVTNVLVLPIQMLWAKATVYLGMSTPAAAVGTEQAAKFPSIISSIVEAGRIDWSIALSKMATASWVSIAGIVCALVLVLFRPETVLLLPMLVIGLMSVKLGSRFAMFGSGATAVFFGLAVNAVGNAVLPEGRLRDRLQIVLQTAVGLALLIPAYLDYKAMPPTPVVTRPHAEALLGLRDRIPENATIWTWWDWGYATWYFSGVRPPIDGGRHSGEDVFPMAYALSTDSPQRANQMLFHAASKNFESFKGMSGKDARALVESFGKTQSSFGVDAPQYFVVCWKNIRLTKWISHFGNWDVQTGDTHEYSIRGAKPSDIRYNLQYGMIANPLGQKSLMKNIDILGAETVNANFYPMNVHSPRLLAKTPNLVINGMMGQPFLLDDDAYMSMLVRLLRDDPNNPQISQYFRLVADGLPFVRIYELVRPDQ